MLQSGLIGFEDACSLPPPRPGRHQPPSRLPAVVVGRRTWDALHLHLEQVPPAVLPLAATVVGVDLERRRLTTQRTTGRQAVPVSSG